MRVRKAYPENPCTLVLGSFNIQALRKDPVDAVADIELALEVVKEVCNERLHPSQPSTDKGQPPNFRL
jgi:hypothetical protein